MKHAILIKHFCCLINKFSWWGEQAVFDEFTQLATQTKQQAETLKTIADKTPEPTTEPVPEPVPENGDGQPGTNG